VSLLPKTTAMKGKKKHPGGRPPTFNSPEVLQAKISSYFKTGVTKRRVVVGKGDNRRIEEIEVPTITGLCYFLGFESRQSFYDYEQKKGFSYTIKKARLFMEQQYEEQLTAGNTIGAIFALKNFGWTDEQVQKHDVSDGLASLMREISGSGDGIPVKGKS
jgi:hypothetical protein